MACAVHLLIVHQNVHGGPTCNKRGRASTTTACNKAWLLSNKQSTCKTPGFVQNVHTGPHTQSQHGNRTFQVRTPAVDQKHCLSRGLPIISKAVRLGCTMSKKATANVALRPAKSGCNAKGPLVHARINLQLFSEGTLAMAGGGAPASALAYACASACVMVGYGPAGAGPDSPCMQHKQA